MAQAGGGAVYLGYKELDGERFLAAPQCKFHHKSFDALEDELGTLETPLQRHVLTFDKPDSYKVLQECKVTVHCTRRSITITSAENFDNSGLTELSQSHIMWDRAFITTATVIHIIWHGLHSLSESLVSSTFSRTIK